MKFSLTSTAFSRLILLAVVLSMLLSTGCSVSTSGSSSVTFDSAATQSAPAADNKGTPDGVVEKIVIAGPGTPSSIPWILAAKKMNNVTVDIIENTSQANTAFLRGDIDVLVSGLSVGVDLYRNEAPVQIVNTSVNGMSFLVTYGEKVDNLRALKGQEIYVPFEGSPIEEAISFLARQEGLVWGEDLKPVYSPFEASIALLKQGKAKAVVLPEPFVSLIEGQSGLFVSIDLYAVWNDVARSNDGYPQVAAFARREWAESHKTELEEFNAALIEAVDYVSNNPNEAVAAVKDSFKQPEPVLLKSVSRMHYLVLSGLEMKQSVSAYYKLIGKPLDDRFEDFYYLP